MRIIKAAKQQDERLESCCHCQSVLGVIKSDIRWEDDKLAFRCPVCGTYNYYASDDKEKLFKWIIEDENEKEIPSGDAVRKYSL